MNVSLPEGMSVPLDAILSYPVLGDVDLDRYPDLILPVLTNITRLVCQCAIHVHVDHNYVHACWAHVCIHVDHMYMHVDHMYMHVNHMYMHVDHMYMHVDHMYMHVRMVCSPVTVTLHVSSSPLGQDLPTHSAHSGRWWMSSQSAVAPSSRPLTSGKT